MTLLLPGYPTLGEIVVAIFVKAPIAMVKQVFCRHKKRRPYNDDYECCLRCGALIQIVR